MIRSEALKETIINNLRDSSVRPSNGKWKQEITTFESPFSMNFISYLYAIPFFSHDIFPASSARFCLFLCATSEEIFTFFILLLVLLIDFRHPFTLLSNRAGKIAKEKLSEFHSRFYFSRFDFTRFMCIFMPSNFIFTRVKC